MRKEGAEDGGGRKAEETKGIMSYDLPSPHKVVLSPIPPSPSNPPTPETSPRFFLYSALIPIWRMSFSNRTPLFLVKNLREKLRVELLEMVACTHTFPPSLPLPPSLPPSLPPHLLYPSSAPGLRPPTRDEKV